jgi:hypothetical protein
MIGQPGQITHSPCHQRWIQQKVPSDDVLEIDIRIVDVVIFMR